MALESILAAFTAAAPTAGAGAVGAGVGAGAVGAGLGAGVAGAASGGAIGAGVGAGVAAAAPTAAGISSGTILASTAAAASVGSSVISGIAAQNQAEAQSDQASINAGLLRRSAEIELAREKRSARARSGQLQLQLASSGFQTTGSALDLISDEFIEQQLNESIILARGSQQQVRQRNIGRSIESRGQSEFIGQTLSGVTQGILLGNQIARESRTGGGLLTRR